MKSVLLALAFSITAVFSHAQKNVYLTITHKLGASNFTIDQTAQNNLMQNFKITRIDYYISGIKVIHDGGMELALPNKYILGKGSATVIESLGNLNVTAVEGIKFSIGVDAPINNADPSLQPPGSPLAFQSPSMHWGWASGYRFVALEGKSGNNLNTTFEIHCLGNANYFQQTKMAAGIPSGTNDVYINLNADYTQALKDINVATGPIDHGVDATDLTVLKNFRDFVFSPSTVIPTSTNTAEEVLGAVIYPNPAAERIYVRFGHQQDAPADKLKITDLLGKIVSENELSLDNEINVNALAKGIYVLHFYKQNAILAHKKMVITE